MKTHVRFIVLSVVLLCIFAVPLLSVHAQTLGIKDICNHPGGKGAPDCNFDDLLNLGRQIINFLIILSIPIATVAFAYAGYLFLTSGGSASQTSKAKSIFTKVLLGFLFVLTAWLIVRTITSALLKPGAYYNPFAVAALSRDC